MAKPKKAASPPDLGILDAVAVPLDRRLAEALSVSEKLSGRWNLSSAAAIPAYAPSRFRRRVYSSGLSSLDRLLRVGGFPRGHIVELFGPPHGGKSLELYQVIASVQRTCTLCEGALTYQDKCDPKGRPTTMAVELLVKGQPASIEIPLRTSRCVTCGALDSGGLVILADQEGVFDPEWVTRQGVELTKLVIVNLPNGEQAAELLRTLLYRVKPELVAIDSVAQLQPKAEQERSEVDDPTLPGLHAKIMARLCRSIVSHFVSDRQNAPLVVWVNQVRADMSGYNQPKVTGGFAPEHYSAIRLYFLPQGLVNQKNPEEGRHGTITVYKCRVAAGVYRKTVKYILVPAGFDTALDTYQTALEAGVFNMAKLTSGKHYFAQDPIDPEHVLANNRAECLERLRTDPELCTRIKTQILQNTALQVAPEVFLGDEVPGHDDEHALA